MNKNLHNPKAVENWKAKALLDGLHKAILGNRTDKEIFAEQEALHEMINEGLTKAQINALNSVSSPHISNVKGLAKKSVKVRSKKLALQRF